MFKILNHTFKTANHRRKKKSKTQPLQLKERKKKELLKSTKSNWQQTTRLTQEASSSWQHSRESQELHEVGGLPPLEARDIYRSVGVIC